MPNTHKVRVGCTERSELHHPATKLPLFLTVLLALLGTPAFALQELEEAQMAEVTGTGLAFVFDDFSFRMAPTSYTELTGSDPTPEALSYGWKRGDARYYGISMTSGSSAGTDWFDSSPGVGCGTGLGCPMGSGDGNDYGINAMASVYDPFVLRVFEYQGYNYDGTWLDDPAGTGGANDMPAVLEIRGPAQSDTWRWAFWGELEIDRLNNNAAIGACNWSDTTNCTTAGADFLQSQTIILGKPVAEGLIWGGVDDDTYTTNPNGPRRTVQRWMHTTNSNDQTFGVTYDSALSGDFRFSVRQTDSSPDALHEVPDFDDQEGLYFKNVDAFIPLGQLHYQALTFSGISEYDQNGNKLPAPVQNGNFSIELTQIPNEPNVYNHFYCGTTGSSPSACTPDGNGAIASPNPDSHGYVRWGDWIGVNGVAAFPGATDIDNGIYFDNGVDPVVNIGVSRIEGMLIHHMKITSLGAGVN